MKDSLKKLENITDEFNEWYNSRISISDSPPTIEILDWFKYRLTDRRIALGDLAFAAMANRLRDQRDVEYKIKPGYVYVASSWRCMTQQAVVHTLRAAEIDCYDFKDSEGFHWSEVNLEYKTSDQLVDCDDYLQALQHPRAIQGFKRDFEAMEKADTFVLVLPCGRSAHLELGWAVGQGKRTAILLDGILVVPELMYKMVDYIAPSMFDLLGWLGVED